MAGVLDQQITDRWAIYNADCMDMLASIPDDSIHATIYSPPFSGLYHYSSDDRDLSNSRDYADFFDHYGYIIREKYRVT
nr:site-specific DNA-methyltransferase [Actinomycetota bacterium]